jgi:methionine synthase I (cobalamin-dependent)
VTNQNFLDRLAHGPILCDGAMGTQLYARGASLESSFEALNLTRPELVSDVHRAYLAAGAEIIESNTFADAVHDRMRLAGDQGRQEGIKIAQELLMELREIAAGVYLMPPFGRFDTAAEVFSVVR